MLLESAPVQFAICITKQKDIAQHLIPSFEYDFSASQRHQGFNEASLK